MQAPELVAAIVHFPQDFIMRLLVLALAGLFALSTPLFAQNDKKADDKKKADPKAPAKTPAKTPAKPAAEADPLKALGTAVDLPPVTPTGKWVTLGKTTIPENLIILFSLRGGDRCLGSGKKVETKEQAGGRSWQCLATMRDGAEPVEIGVFRIEKGAVQFAWSSGAESFSGAGLLRNAAFEIAVGTSKKVVGLRKPIKGEPLEIGYDEISSVLLDIPDAPVLSSVRIEIDMPSPEYRSKNVNWRLLGDGPALKGSDDRMWAESIRLGRLAVKLETTAGKNIKLTATPMFWIADREKPQRLTQKNITAAVAQVDLYQDQLTARRDALTKNKAATAQRDAMTKELAEVRKANSDLVDLQDFVKTVKLGKMHYKVSHELEPGYVVPLLTTK
jgi:hypothetical protein